MCIRDSSKNRVADVPIVGDLAEVITELNTLLRGADLPDRREWVSYLQGLRQRYTPTEFEPIEDDELLSPEYVIKRIGEIAGPRAKMCIRDRC